MRYTLVAALMLFVSLSAFATKDRAWKIGKLLDSRSAKTFMVDGATSQGTAITNTSGTAMQNGNTATVDATSTTHATSDTQIHNMTVQETQFLIVGDDFLYVVSDSVEKGVGPAAYGALAHAIANRKHGCHLIVNDPVKYFQEKGTVYVLDVEGKECKMELVRQERVLKPALKAEDKK